MKGLDVETTSLNPDEGDLRLVQIGDENRVRVMDAFFMPADTIKEAIDEEDDLVAHNATFEAAWLRAKLGAAPKLDDTMIMSQVYHTGTKASKRSSFGHSLAAVVGRELKRELAKDEQVSDWGAAALTREQLEYAARDAAVLPPLADRLLTKIEKVGLQGVYELELRVSHAIDAMQRRGVAIHTDRLEAMIEEATERSERLKTELAEEWGINPGSSKQLREHFALDGREDWPKTPAGAASTNQEAMKTLLAEEESVAKWLQWKEVEKIRSTYGESLRKALTPEGRIHARFKPFGTVTGRFSSSGPNLQNIPEGGSSARGCAGSSGAVRTIASLSRLTTPRSSSGWRRSCGTTPICRRRSGRASTCTSRRRPPSSASSRRRSRRSKIRRRITSAFPA